MTTGTVQDFNYAPQPAESFQNYCHDIIDRWETGQINYKVALETLRLMCDEARRDRHLANEGAAETAMGYIQHYRGNLAISIQHWQQARACFHQVGNLAKMATIDLNQGENYRFKGNINQASRLFRSAYEMAEQLDLTDVQASSALNEGLMLVDYGRFIAGRKRLEMAYQLCHNVEDEKLKAGILCEIYSGMALIHIHNRDFHAAWDVATESLQIAIRSGEALSLGFAHRTLGIVIAAIGKPMSSEYDTDPITYFKDSIRVFQEINAEGQIARTILAEADTLAKRGRKQAAVRKLQHVMVTFTRLGMLGDAARAAEMQGHLIARDNKRH